MLDIELFDVASNFSTWHRTFRRGVEMFDVGHRNVGGECPLTSNVPTFPHRRIRQRSHSCCATVLLGRCRKTLSGLASLFRWGRRISGIDLLKDKQALQRLTEASEKAKVELGESPPLCTPRPLCTPGPLGRGSWKIGCGRSRKVSGNFPRASGSLLESFRNLPETFRKVSERLVYQNTVFLRCQPFGNLSGKLPETSGRFLEASGSFCKASGSFG